MFKRLRRNIVITVMLSLVAFLLVTLCAIYYFSYQQISRENMEMLERYSSIFSLEAPPGSSLPPDLPDAAPTDAPLIPDTDTSENAFQLSTFYSVALDDQGNVLATDKGRSGIYTEAELETIADDILETGNSSGRMGSLIYLITDKTDYTLVAFRDNTETESSFHTLLTITLVTGCIAIVVLFILVCGLSGRLVRPLMENDLKQKQFVSDAGHELKTPISVIDANAELLSRQIGENTWLDNIRYESDRMRVLITQLLDLSRAENAAPVTESLDLSRLTAGEVLAMESLAFENGLQIEEDIENGIVLNGSRTQLAQLTAILLDNAIRHSKGADTIRLSLKKDRQHAVLSVSNHGDPMTPQDIEHAFDRFYRADQARNDTGHYGLGLAIAKAITSSHKGNISASCSDHVITFTVTLPI